MLLRAHDSIDLFRYQRLNAFLSPNENTEEKLGRYQATEFEVLRYIGSGSEGLVLECHTPQSDASVALKLV
jgi:hypothetical protein